MMFRRVSTGLAAVAVLSMPVAAAADTLMQKLLRVAGLAATPAPVRAAADKVSPGNIWMAAADRTASKGLTTDGGYTSPIFSPDGRVYALRAGALVRLPQEMGGGVVVHRVPGAVKLVGFDGANPDDLVLLLDTASGGSPLGVLSLKSGKVTPLAFDGTNEEERRMLAQIRGQSREYGTARVYARRESRGGGVPVTDVYIRRGTAAARKISACNSGSCAQPALSPDGQRVAFIKSDR
jgi:ABC-type amino acid transport substrate-binding protein